MQVGLKDEGGKQIRALLGDAGSLTNVTYCKPRGYSIKDLLSVSSLEAVQASIAAVAEATVAICDHEGRPVLGPVYRSRFFELLVNAGFSLGVAASELHGGSVPTLPDPHRAIAQSDDHEGSAPPFDDGLDRHVAPITVTNYLLGSIVMGDRFSRRIPPADLLALARRHGVDFAELQAAYDELRPWLPGEREASRQLVDLFANTLSRLCLQELRVRQRVDEINAVGRVAGLLSGTTDLDQILRITAKEVCDALDVKACIIRLLSDDKNELILAAGHNLSKEYIDKGLVRVSNSPIDEAVMRGETVYIEDAPNDPRLRYPEQARREGIVSGLCVAMIYRGETLGIIRAYSGRLQQFTPSEETLLRAMASQTAAAIANARLYREALEADRYAYQLAYAGAIQRRMIPPPPAHRRLAISAVYAPTLQVGGDFYDFIELPHEHLGLCIADVVGKGVPAALIMASVRSSLRAYTHSIYSIHEIISEVNRLLCRDTITSEFVTLFYGVFDPHQSRLTYCNAGHDPPLLLRGATISKLETGGMVVGVAPEAAFQQDVVELRSGDVLLFYTDGACDSLNFAGDNFGRDRLADSFRRHAGDDPARIAQNILWDIRRFVGLADQTDDVSLVVVKVR